MSDTVLHVFLGFRSQTFTDLYNTTPMSARVRNTDSMTAMFRNHVHFCETASN